MKTEKTKNDKVKSEKIKLIAVSPEMKNRIMEYRSEFLENGEAGIDGSCLLQNFEAFDAWFKTLRNSPDSRPADNRPTDNCVPSSTFAAVRLSDNVIVGMVNIRHYLTEAIYQNGHIGYSVRPNERRKGYGAEILRQALIKAEQLGIIETVVSRGSNKENL